MLMFPLVLGFSSCDKHELEPNPLAKDISGMWYNITDTKGSLPEAYGGDEYTRVIEVLLLNDDGTGYGCSLFLNEEESIPISGFGGFDEQGLTPFSYTTKQDGRITLRFDKENTAKEYADIFSKWNLRYADGIINCSDDTHTFDMQKANAQMEAWLWSTYRSWAGGASAASFNINDADFTPDTWRDQEAIYIWDGTTKITSANVKDPDTYTVVNMPWYEGDKLTNLPDGFCDDITPGNGWEWVFNRCGSTSIPNNNFFAVYNKYSGILRFFYYLPQGFNTGNDHVWQVSMTDHLAQQSLWRYGLPADRTIIDKVALGQTGSGTFMEYVTPWADYMSQDGLIVPNAGWWAFDIDLSQTRSDGIISTDNIRLQMRSWNTSHVSLASTVAANIEGTYDGKFDLTKTTVSSAKGLTESLSDIKDVGKDLFDAVKSAISGDWKDAIKSGFSFAKGAYDVYGAMNKETTTTVDTLAKGSLTGTITLGLKGTIDTEGTIQGSAPTVGIASPTFYLKDFDTKHSHIGQGVWNLKTAPVVYWTKVDAWWAEDQWKVASYSNGQPVYAYNYRQMRPFFFDPNSIEVELNSNIFPESEIEWMEVNAVCGARKQSQLLNDALRSAYGLQGETTKKFAVNGLTNDDAKGRGYISRHLDDNDILMDFLHDYDDKQGMVASYEVYSVEGGDSWNSVKWNWTETVKGRGADGYAIEPQYLGGYRQTYMPFIEVSVTVRVKLKSMKKPVLLSRNYLPEIRTFDPDEFDQAIHKTKPYASKTEGHTGLYDYQMKRIYAILSKYEIDATFPDGYLPKLKATSGTAGYYDRIFDGKWDTYWQTSKYEQTDGMWFVEFNSTRPFVPVHYYLVPGPGIANYSSRVSMNPYNWRLKAKAGKGDEWTTIATVTNDDKLPGGYDTPNHSQVRVEYPLDVTGKTWQYFRLEILNTRNSLDPNEYGQLQLSEFDFGLND